MGPPEGRKKEKGYPMQALECHGIEWILFRVVCHTPKPWLVIRINPSCPHSLIAVSTIPGKWHTTCNRHSEAAFTLETFRRAALSSDQHILPAGVWRRGREENQVKEDTGTG